MKTLKSYKIFEKDIKHLYQPNAYTCGVTCIKMVLDFLKKENKSIEELSKLANCNKLTGTVLSNMKKLLDINDINYDLFKDLNHQEIIDNIKKDDCVYVIMIWLGDVPHWILIKDYQDDEYVVNDPWQGEIVLSTEELNEMFNYDKINIYSVGVKLLVPYKIIKINL